MCGGVAVWEDRIQKSFPAIWEEVKHIHRGWQLIAFGDDPTGRKEYVVLSKLV